MSDDPMLQGKQLENREEQLLIEIARLRQEIEQCRQANRDLHLAMTTISEHGDTIEAELCSMNQQLLTEIEERKRAEANLKTLLKAISQRKSDLEIVVQTIMEHGDVMDIQWEQKLTEMSKIATLDGLTQIANRRRFDEHLAQQWKQMAREHLPLSVVICDIDHFKQFNDTYGHLAGDDCLQQVAHVLNGCINRSIDLVARFGGEEFAAILPQTGLDGAVHVAQHMHSEVAQLQIQHSRSISSCVSLSIGVACVIPSPQTSYEKLLHTADQHLYSAKQTGRNRIVFGSNSSPALT